MFGARDAVHELRRRLFGEWLEDSWYCLIDDLGPSRVLSRPLLLRVEEWSDGTYLVVEPETDCYGDGPSPHQAIADLKVSVCELYGMMVKEHKSGRLGERIDWQYATLRRLLGDDDA